MPERSSPVGGDQPLARTVSDEPLARAASEKQKEETPRPAEESRSSSEGQREAPQDEAPQAEAEREESPGTAKEEKSFLNKIKDRLTGD